MSEEEAKRQARRVARQLGVRLPDENVPDENELIRFAGRNILDPSRVTGSQQPLRAEFIPNPPPKPKPKG